MRREQLKSILQLLENGSISIDAALDEISFAPIRDIDFAQLDTNRGLIKGRGEVIYGAGKTAAQIIAIVKELQESGQGHILITRIDEEKATALCEEVADTDYHAASQLAVVGGMAKADGQGSIVVFAAGTSDLAVAEEAALTAEFLGNKTELVMDVGVAGIHRILGQAERIAHASVIIVVAGMEGALPSVVGGLAHTPIIAVPTSVGYGASYGGLTALLSMMNSCASGVSVVNIDNGFGAGYQAHLINHVGID